MCWSTMPPPQIPISKQLNFWWYLIIDLMSITLLFLFPSITTFQTLVQQLFAGVFVYSIQYTSLCSRAGGIQYNGFEPQWTRTMKVSWFQDDGYGLGDPGAVLSKHKLSFETLISSSIWFQKLRRLAKLHCNLGWPLFTRRIQEAANVDCDNGKVTVHNCYSWESLRKAPDLLDR